MHQVSDRLMRKQTIAKAGRKLRQVCRTKRAKMGMGTLEVVIIIAALLTLALFFSAEIKGFAGTIADKAFQETKVLAELEKDVGQ